MTKVNPAVPVMLTGRELTLLRNAIPYRYSRGTLVDKLRQAEKDVLVVTRAARREAKIAKARKDSGVVPDSIGTGLRV